MIVPQTRLVAWSAIVLVPCGAVAAGGGFALAVSCAIMGLFALLAVVDLAASRKRVAGIRVELQETVRLQREHPGEIELRIHNESPRARTLRLRTRVSQGNRSRAG